MTGRTLTPLQRDCRALVRYYAWDLAAAVEAIRRHRPDDRDHCAECSTALHSSEWPCLTFVMATTGYELMADLLENPDLTERQKAIQRALGLRSRSIPEPRRH